MASILYQRIVYRAPIEYSQTIYAQTAAWKQG